MPDNLQGQSEAYVRNALKDLVWWMVASPLWRALPVSCGYGCGAFPEKGSTDDKGVQTVEAGGTVNIVLSSGKVKVPSLVGLTRIRRLLL